MDSLTDWDLSKQNSLVQSVKTEVAWLKGNPVIREELKKGIRGFVFDLKTGKVEEVPSNLHA